MPELPEVEALARFLAREAVGREVAEARLLAIHALKTFDPPLEALPGRTVAGAGRRGKFLLLDLDGVWLVTHLARGGWLRWYDVAPTGAARPGKGPLALRVRFADGAGFELTEAGTEKRLAVYVVRDPAEVEGLARLGPEALDLDRDGFAAVLAGQAGQLKGVLTDQTVVAGVGNAYSDEVLHVAKLSPFKKASSLSPEEVDRLYAALHEVLDDAVRRSADLPAAGLKKEKKSGLRVHGRTGESCPVCGDTVREVSFATSSLQYCPTCQTGGKVLADRRLSRLLK